MINLINQDHSFFNITSKDVDMTVLNEDIISFTYEEEMSRYNTGSISLYDEGHKYSKILRLGARLDISFGYLKKDDSIKNVLTKTLNPRELHGGTARTGIKGIIQSPNGSGSNTGVVTYNCNFFGNEYLQGKEYRIYVGITRGHLVRLLLTEIGAVDVMVNFTRQNEVLNEDTQVIQRETHYRLLLRFAREWRAIFRISYNSKGKLTAIFVSPSALPNVGIPILMSGAIGGDTILLDYKGSINNVIEYTWANKAGEGGQGDNVRIVTGADGNPTFLRYVTSGDSVRVYKLNENRIKNKLRGAKNFQERNKLIKEWVSAEDFAQVKWAFDPIDQSTAPQGLGYTMDAKMLGNPLMSAPLKVLFTETFPVWFSPKNDNTHVVKYYARKVTHTIDRSGYKMNLGIMDAFTMHGGSLI